MASMPPTPEALIAHADFLRGLARSLLRDEHRAEDVVQQTYVQALTRPPARNGIRSWLATVAQRLALNERRTSARRAHREEISAGAQTTVPSTEEIVQREAMRMQVVEAVLRLEEPYRSTVVLRYFESLSPAEIGKRLDVSASTVRSRLQRAHHMLRSNLDASHAGERSRWSTLLAPWARPLSGVATGATLFPAFLMMKKTVVVVAACLVAAVAWFAWDATAPVQETPGGTPTASSPGLLATKPEPAVAVPPNRAEVPIAADPQPSDGIGMAVSPSYAAALVGFRGRVVDSDGTPVPECGVEIFRLALDALMYPDLTAGTLGPKIRAARTTTDADGAFVLRGVRPRGLFLLKAGLGTADPLTQLVQQTPEPGETVDLGDVTLRALASITGRVVDQAGGPVAGAEVLSFDLPSVFLGIAPVYGFAPDGAVFLRMESAPVSVLELPSWVAEVVDSLPIPRTRTSEDGFFELVGVPPETTALAVVAQDRLPLLRSGVRIDAGERQDLGELRLEAGRRVVGRVLDKEGKPLPGAEVLVAPNNPTLPVDFAGPSAIADSNGRFAATGLPTGPLNFAARRSPGHRWVVAGPMDEEGDVVVRLPELHTLTLTLSSSAALPIESPTCSVLMGHGVGLPEIAAYGLVPPMKLDGRVEIAGEQVRVRDLEPGSYTFRVSDPAHATATVQVDFDADSHVRVTLVPRTTLTVRAVDATGAPVAGARIFAQPTPSAAWPAALPVPCGETDATGRVSLDHVPGPRIEVIASHPAFGETRGTAERGRAANTLTFGEIGTIEGVVHDGAHPIEVGQWSVLLQSDGTGFVPPFPRITQPDGEGRFQFSAVPPGVYQVQVVESLDTILTPGAFVELGRYSWMPSPRIAEVEVQGGRTAQTRLDVADPSESESGPSARVSGTVLIDGRPSPGMMVIAQVGEDRDPMITRVDRDGRFDLGRIPSGIRYVSAFDIEQQSPADNQPHMMWAEFVEVPDGIDQELSVDVRTGVLAGEVVDADGQPVASAWVEAQGILSAPPPSPTKPLRSRYVVRTDQDGKFEIQSVAPGTWTVGNRTFGSSTMNSVQKDIVLEAGQRLSDVRIHLDR